MYLCIYAYKSHTVISILVKSTSRNLEDYYKSPISKEKNRDIIKVPCQKNFGYGYYKKIGILGDKNTIMKIEFYENCILL